VCYRMVVIAVVIVVVCGRAVVCGRMVVIAVVCGRMVVIAVVWWGGGCCWLSQPPRDDVLTFAWTTNTAFCHHFN